MPLLLVFAFVPAILLIALAVMLISGTILFLTNRGSVTREQLFYNGCKSAFDKVNEKVEDVKKVQQAKKYKNVQTIDVIILKEK